MVAGATLTLAAAFLVPSIGRMFRFGPVSLDDFALATAAGLASLAWFEVLKLFKPAWLVRA